MSVGVVGLFLVYMTPCGESLPVYILISDPGSLPESTRTVRNIVVRMHKTLWSFLSRGAKV